jgi:hypothetical protein
MRYFVPEIRLASELPTQARIQDKLPKQPDFLTYFCDGPNFGDAGMSYIFLKDTRALPQGWFFWQSG